MDEIEVCMYEWGFKSCCLTQLHITNIIREELSYSAYYEAEGN